MDMRARIDNLMQALKRQFVGGKSPAAPSAAPADKPGFWEGRSRGASSSLLKSLVGNVSGVEETFFPPEIIGGCCPRVAGQEDDIVWNAAAEVCDSERVHVVWQSYNDKVWYLAIRSGELASHPNSWCPFAALLPGMKDAQPAPVCYTYYSEEMATMMMVSPDGLQIFRGTNLVVRAKAERTARELGDARIVELIPDLVEKLTPVPWYSLSLFEDRARRILATFAVVFSIGLTTIAFVVWVLASMVLIASRHDLREALQNTEAKTLQLMNDVQKMRASPLREMVAGFAELNDQLLEINGYLEIYAIDRGKVRWRASVPANVTADRINALGGKTIEARATETIIGNQTQIDFEKTSGGKR